MASVPISGLPEATAVGNNDLLASTQADQVTRKINLGQIVSLVSAGVSSFVNLSDTPGSYAGSASRKVKVRSDELGLEFLVDESFENGLTRDVLGVVRLGGLLTQDTFIGAASSGFNLQLDAQNVDLLADSGIKLSAATGQINIAAPTNPVTVDGASIVTSATGDNTVKSTTLDVLIDAALAARIDGASVAIEAGTTNVQITAGSGNVLLDADVLIDLQSQGNVSLNADGGSAIVNALADVNLTAGNDVNLSAATGIIDVDGGAVDIDSAGSMMIDAAGDVEITAGNNLELDGSGGQLQFFPPGGAPTIGDVLTAIDVGGSTEWQAPPGQSVKFASWFLPFNAIADASFPLVGETSQIAAGLVADFATQTTMRNAHTSILVNSITTGGDIVVSGDSISPSTGVVTSADTETITVDTTAAQRYQSDKIWLEISSVDISSGAITGLNYDLDRISYLFDRIEEIPNAQNIQVLGYRIQFQTNNNNSDLQMQMFVIRDGGAKKVSIGSIEDVLWQSTVGNGNITDGLRTAGANRDFTATVTMIGSGNVFTYIMTDFNDFFTSDENVIRPGTNDGLQIFFTGTAGGLNNIEHGTLTIAWLEVAP